MSEATTTDNGFRSRCCYASIRMGRKKIKQTNTTVPIWICCNCGKRNVAIIEASKSTSVFASDDEVDRDDPDLLS